jgi:cysteine desulfurase/selenocysteine lyase|tara:strand:- start:1110 stop:2354 length:1245 start_codon:yes stop_codon:yes gene_type:complete
MSEKSELFDPETIKALFPTLSQTVSDKPLVYLDNAATSQKPVRVIEALETYYRDNNSNVHRGIYELSRRATEAYENARSRMAQFIGAESPEEIIWTRGTTEGINLVANSWGMKNLSVNDEILLTTMEHHSNIVPWQLVAEKTGATIRYIEMDAEGHLNLENLEELCGRNTKIVSCTQVSNSLGTINPLEPIIAQARSVGALVLVDGAQAVPHGAIDVGRIDCDFYVFSGHKMCGPTGIGVLWGRKEILDKMPPYQGGGEMIKLVQRDHSTWADLPHKFEAGTPNIAGAIVLATAADFLDEIGFEAIKEHEHNLLAYALDQLDAVEGLKIFGPLDSNHRCSVISFQLGDIHPLDVSTILDAEGIAIRVGHHCAQLVMEHLGVSVTARASFYLYNTYGDVDRLVSGLNSVNRIFAS